MEFVRVTEALESGKSRSGGYASPSILARRHRILREARKMIAKGGISTLSMDEVSRRAGVAKRTLYNAFQSKERLIAAAIQQYFDDYANRITYTTEEATLERMLERLVIVARRNLAIRNYTRALMDVYFSHAVDPDIRHAIHRIAAEAQEPLLHALARKRQLQSWVNIEVLSNNMVRVRYSIAHAWAEGLISDEDFLLELARGFFTYLAGACCGSARKQIDALIKDLPDHPLFQAVDNGTLHAEEAIPALGA
jgi:TetR/AcrR family transcriptional regulator, cholesterol catabolism regulator